MPAPHPGLPAGPPAGAAPPLARAPRFVRTYERTGCCTWRCYLAANLAGVVLTAAGTCHATGISGTIGGDSATNSACERDQVCGAGSVGRPLRAASYSSLRDSPNPLRGFGPAGDGRLTHDAVPLRGVVLTWWARRPARPQGHKGLDPGPAARRLAAMGAKPPSAQAPPRQAERHCLVMGCSVNWRQAARSGPDRQRQTRCPAPRRRCADDLPRMPVPRHLLQI